MQPIFTSRFYIIDVRSATYRHMIALVPTFELSDSLHLIMYSLSYVLQELLVSFFSFIDVIF